MNIKARKYQARVALHIDPKEDPRLSILEEKFTGKDTWASPKYRKPTTEIDKELRYQATREILQIATIGVNPYFVKGRDDNPFNEVIPQNFQGIMIFDLFLDSNNAEGHVGTRYKEIQRAPYLLQLNEQINLTREKLKLSKRYNHSATEYYRRIEV